MNTVRQLFVLFFCVLVTDATAHEPTVFQMCYEDKQLLPYFTGSGKKVPEENPGVSIEVLNIMGEKLKEISLSFRREPWKRCLALLGNGEVSGVIASYRKSRHKLGVYPMREGKPDTSRAFEMTQYCLYSKGQDGLRWDGTSFHNAQNLPVAVPLGYSILNLFQNHNINVLEVNSSDRGFFLLNNDRVAATATLCESGNQILALNNEYREIKQNQEPLRTKGSYLVISHQFYQQYPELSQRIWDSIVTINQRTYQQIYQRYVEQ